LFFIKNIQFNNYSTQENITALLNELQLETYLQYHTGKSIAELHRRVHKYSLPIPYISLLSFLESIYNVFRVEIKSNKFYFLIFVYCSLKLPHRMFQHGIQ
jgi:hypothetical protein